MIAPGDEVYVDGRANPIEVKSIRLVGDYEGSIYVSWECVCEGPEGAHIRIQRTGTERLRMSPSKYAPFKNIEDPPALK